MDCSLIDSSVHGDSPGKNTGVGSHALLQGIFPTQGSNPGLPHCRWSLYCLSHWGARIYVTIHSYSSLYLYIYIISFYFFINAIILFIVFYTLPIHLICLGHHLIITHKNLIHSSEFLHRIFIWFIIVNHFPVEEYLDC